MAEANKVRDRVCKTCKQTISTTAQGIKDHQTEHEQ